MLDTLSQYGQVKVETHFGGACRCAARISSYHLYRIAKDGNVDAALESGRALYYQQRWDEAIAVLQGAGVNNPHQPLIDYYLGASYICLGDGVQAAKYWKKEEMAWQAFKGIYRCQRVNEFGRAETLYDLAITAQPNIVDAEYQLPDDALAYYFSAATIARENDLPAAELQWLQTGLEKFPKDSLAYYRMGEYYEHKGDLLQANGYYRKAVILYPDDSAIYQHYIRTSLLLARWREGAVAIEQLMFDVQPTNKNQMKVIINLVRNNLSPEMCTYLNRSFGDVDEVLNDDLLEMVATIQSVCAAVE